MPLLPTMQLTPEVIFLIFVLFVFLVSRAAKIFLRALLFAAIGFSFPWVAQYIGLSIGVLPTIENGILFAAAAAGLFFAYEFFHFILAASKIITWLPRRILNMTKENEIKELQKEMRKIENEKRDKK